MIGDLVDIAFASGAVRRCIWLGDGLDVLGRLPGTGTGTVGIRCKWVWDVGRSRTVRLFQNDAVHRIVSRAE